jgi:RimJ/RimL family protein N-acetyltransferase
MQKHLLDIDTAIITPRTVVRRFREGEGALLHECIQDNYSRLQDHFPLTLQEINSPEAAEFFVRKRLADWLLQHEYCMGLWHTRDARLIGLIRIFRIQWQVPKAETGYFIDKQYEQKGLMTEAMKAVLDFTFRQLNIEKLSLRTSVENIPSQRLARKAGFRREGDIRADFRKLSGELIDTLHYGLTRAEWMGF